MQINLDFITDFKNGLENFYSSFFKIIEFIFNFIVLSIFNFFHKK